MEMKILLNKNYKEILALCIFFLFWTLLLTFSGTIRSGFHFVDDHEIITIWKNIQDNGLFTASKSIIKEDLTIRLRPVYFIHRIALVKLFGTHFIYWSLYNVLLAILSSFFLFLFLYRQGFNFMNSILFPFLSLIGAQSAVWWRLGPQESLGVFLLSVSLFLLVNSVFRERKFHLSISVAFLFLASLTKESFLIFIPAYILLLIWLNVVHRHFSAFSIIKRHLILIISILLFFIISAYLIVYRIGTNQTGYAGFDNAFHIRKYLTGIINHLRHNYYLYLIIAGSLFLVQNKKSWKIYALLNLRELKPYLYNAAICLAIVLPQFILYNKTGLWERYLLILNLGYSFFVIFLSEMIYRSEIVSIFTKKTYAIFIVVITFSFLIKDTLPAAKLFAHDGLSTNKLLASIKDNSTSADSLLVVLNGYIHYEQGFSIRDYLTIVADRKNIKFYLINIPTDDVVEKGMNKRFLNKFDTVIVKDLGDNYSCIAIFPSVNNQEIISKLDSNVVYQGNDFDDYTVYLRKK